MDEFRKQIEIFIKEFEKRVKVMDLLGFIPVFDPNLKNEITTEIKDDNIIMKHSNPLRIFWLEKDKIKDYEIKENKEVK